MLLDGAIAIPARRFGYALPRTVRGVLDDSHPDPAGAAPALLRTGFVSRHRRCCLCRACWQPYDPGQPARSELMGIVVKEVLLGMADRLRHRAIPLWALRGDGRHSSTTSAAPASRRSINPLTGHDSSPLGELFSQAVDDLPAGKRRHGRSLLGVVVFRAIEIWPVFGSLPRIDANAGVVLLSLFDRLTRLAVLTGGAGADRHVHGRDGSRAGQPLRAAAAGLLPGDGRSRARWRCSCWRSMA